MKRQSGWSRTSWRKAYPSVKIHNFKEWFLVLNMCIGLKRIWKQIVLLISLISIYIYIWVKLLAVWVAQSCLTLCDPMNCIDHQAPLSMGFSLEYWSGWPSPSPEDLPNPGIEPGSPVLLAGSSPSQPPGKPRIMSVYIGLVEEAFWVFLKMLWKNPKEFSGRRGVFINALSSPLYAVASAVFSACISLLLPHSLCSQQVHPRDSVFSVQLNSVPSKETPSCIRPTSDPQAGRRAFSVLIASGAPPASQRLTHPYLTRSLYNIAFRDPGWIHGLGRSLGEGNGNPLQCSCLENPMDRGAWRAAVHGVAKSWTWLSDWHYLLIADFALPC